MEPEAPDGHPAPRAVPRVQAHASFSGLRELCVSVGPRFASAFRCLASTRTLCAVRVQDNLCGPGSGCTIMVLNVGPSPDDFDETVHALKYGAVAKEITIAPSKVDTRSVAAAARPFVIPSPALLLEHYRDPVPLRPTCTVCTDGRQRRLPA